MAEIRRQSPVRFKATPIKTELRDNWTVVLAYDHEGPGPWLVDLSHKTRWDLQDSRIDEQTISDLRMPEVPGTCTLKNGTLINRMHSSRASIYHLGGEAPDTGNFSGFTDISESTLFLALFGPRAFRVAEKLTDLDLMDPARKPPFLMQGPFCHVPCQIVTLEKAAGFTGGFLLTCSRGYGDRMVHAILEAGTETGLKPGGENRFDHWLQGLQG